MCMGIESIIDFNNMVIGERVSFNAFCHITASPRAKVFIGDDVLIGPHVVVNTGNHVYAKLDKTIRQQGHDEKEVRIGNDVWIGANSVILKGAVVPDKCVIGACSLVLETDILLAGHVYAGNPLREIGKRA